MSAPARDDVTSNPVARWNAGALADFASLCEASRCGVAIDEPLARHTTMGVGGPTPLMFSPTHPEAVATTIDWCAARGLSWRVLGGGTNVLVADTGVAEPVLSLTRLTDGVRIDAARVRFPAGLPTAQALRVAAREGLGGLVWSTGLPGTIGGAVAGNAGCWGGEMADVVARLDLVGADGAWRSAGPGLLEWSYRRLHIADAPAAVIVFVEVELHAADRDTLEAASEELQQRKRERQPVGARNAGCIFKNPGPDRPAGLLIDRAGCKGMRVGDAQISELHGNFLINRGAATAADVERLIAAVKKAVRERLDTHLEEEIRRW